jgi:hypothetical protein
MPYKFETDNLVIPTKLKKTAKLTAEDKEEIRYRYLKVGGVSQRDLAKEYDVSRRLIVFCIYPERQKANYAKRVANGGSRQYYDKEKQTESMRKHRRYKQELKLGGKLKERDETKS